MRRMSVLLVTLLVVLVIAVPLLSACGEKEEATPTPAATTKPKVTPTPAATAKPKVTPLTGDSIVLDSISPATGTRVEAGKTVEVTAQVSYSLDSLSDAVLSLLYSEFPYWEDQPNFTPFAQQRVTKGSGTVTIAGQFEAPNTAGINLVAFMAKNDGSRSIASKTAAVYSTGAVATIKPDSKLPSPPQPPPPPPDCYGNSLRLMTYNVAMLATGDSNEDIYLMDDTERAAIIADNILKEEHDIIVLAETFHDAGKDVFVSKLSGTYPHYIYKLDDDSDLDQDSGLMLFSRYPFAPLPKDTYKADLDDVTASSSSSPNYIWKDVAWMVFDDCQSWDCWANKGVGLVRIKVPCTGSYVNVAFTHLQASYGSDSATEAELAVATRHKQLVDIEKVIKGTLTDNQLATEQIYLMGDLNINGNQFNMEPLYWSNKSEWTTRFDSGEFFATVLKDSWAFQTSPADPGQTTGGGFPFFPGSEKDGERLDYILYSSAAMTASPSLAGVPGYCVQYLSKAWELADDDGSQHYSDHFALKADINLQAAYCNPLEAHVVNPQPDEFVNGLITYPGSMQWYRIDEPGSYSIKVSATGGEVEFQVYESDDLSRPIKNYHGEVTEWGLKFVMPEAPFYVRVFAPDRSWHGEYHISFHKHRGGSYADSITLLPARPQTYQMPSMPLNSEDAVWFDFQTDVSDNNEYPQLQFLLSYQQSNMFSFQLLNSSKAVLSVPGDISESPTNVGFETLMKRANLSKGKYYLKILPKIPNPSGKEFSIEWRTTLTYFIARTLDCGIQSDTFGDDTIYALIQVDPAEGGYHAYNLGDFDEGTQKGVTAETGGVRKYVQNIWVQLWEIDCDEDNDAWVSNPGAVQTQTTYWDDPACGDDPFEKINLGSLAPDQYELQQPQLGWKDGDDYEYVMVVQLARDLNDIQ
jgi:endonuclease/exonuclease/phosphatase family metal-dependent hydrolase